jgi:multidrug resistance efflux pump
VVAAVASAVALIPGAISSREIGPRLTHTITRGDLIVTVTEQGTLESAENTEIKCKVRTAAVPIIWVIEGGTQVKPGDELVRLETLEYEDRLNEVSKWAHATRSAAERSRADVARAQLAVPEYLEGRYRAQLMTLQKDLAIAESNLRTAQNMLGHAETMAARGYVSELDVEDKTFAVTQAELNVDVKKTEIEVLKNFTRAMELETLNGNLKASKAKHEADKEMAKHLAAQVDLALADIEYCVVKAETSGLVIYPTARPWERAPEIEEGATVYMGQTMLLMPDMTRMQVKISIHESFIDRMRPGLAARVALPDRTLAGEVSSVASVTEPAGEWNG